MSKHDEFIIEPRDNGQWAVMKPHAERASSVEDSYRDACGLRQRTCARGRYKGQGTQWQVSPCPKRPSLGKGR